MDTIQENMEDLVTHVMDYMDNQKALLVLNAQEKAALAISSAVSWTLFGVFILFAFGMLSTGLSIWLGLLLNNMVLGFLAIGMVYLILAIVVFIFRKSLFQHRLGHYLTIKFTQENEQ
jgi:Putative Actinobacterial Holin-X, holin superfamily III